MRRSRVYECQNVSCKWSGKKTEFEYIPKTKRVCPKCGKDVRRVYTEKKEGA